MEAVIEIDETGKCSRLVVFDTTNECIDFYLKNKNEREKAGFGYYVGVPIIKGVEVNLQSFLF